MKREIGFDSTVIKNSLADVGFNDFEIYRANQGVSTMVYRMVRNKDIFFLRVADEGKTFWSEAEAHRLGINAGVKLPKIIFYEEENQVLKRCLMITEAVQGESLRNKNVTTEVIREAGRNLAMFNQITIPGVGWISDDVGSCEIKGIGTDYSTFILKDFESEIQKLVEIGLFDIGTGEKIRSFVAKNKTKLLEYQQGHLVHGDFSLEHIFALNGKFSGFIDLGDIRAASVYHDLAHFYIYARKYFDDLLTAYKEVTQLDGDWRERMEIEAMLIAIGKMWWVNEMQINKLTKDRADYRTVMELTK